jgi:hypothetical protein
MIEVELPEPRFEELTLVSDVPHRGKGDAGAEPPLRGWVEVSGPDGFTAATVATVGWLAAGRGFI